MFAEDAVEEEVGNLDFVARGRLFLAAAPSCSPCSADGGADTPSPAAAPMSSLS